MATVVHTDWLNGMLGNPTHSVIDFDTDNIDASLLDQTDSGTITNANVTYGEVNGADVVSTTDVSISSIANGIVTATGTIVFSAVTMPLAIEEIETSVVDTTSAPFTSP